MDAKIKFKKLTLPILFLFAFVGLNCSGGGGGSSSSNTSNPEPVLNVLPAAFDFGTITSGNSAEPLEVIIQNEGTADLEISNIELSETTNFELDLSGGTEPCGSEPVTISAGSSCSVTVDFIPQTADTFNADLLIESNDTSDPDYVLSLLGTYEEIDEISIKINQIDACPRPDITAYVSVTDQGGFPISGLTADDFTLTEDGGNTEINPSTVDFVESAASISVALLMDYSGSIANAPENVSDMENAALSIVDQMGANDEAAIIKYATEVEITQEFTSDEADLNDAILTTPDIGDHTALYDALVEAINLTESRGKDRRAIIIITDGKDDDGSGDPISTYDSEDVINDANTANIPIFTVGLGNADETILQQIADDTGGTYSTSVTSDNLTTIYKQLANLLFIDQYILTYTSSIGGANEGTLSVTATVGSEISEPDEKSISTCP